MFLYGNMAKFHWSFQTSKTQPKKKKTTDIADNLSLLLLFFGVFFNFWGPYSFPSEWIYKWMSVRVVYSNTHFFQYLLSKNWNNQPTTRYLTGERVTIVFFLILIHRIIKWSGKEGTLKMNLFPNPHHGQGCHPLDQDARGNS